MIFKTKELVIRNLCDDDFAAFHEMQSDDLVMRYTCEQGTGHSESTNREQFAQCIESYSKPSNDFWVWAIVGPNEEFVGTCAVVSTEDGEDEIGYRFLRKYWGRGFGKQIVDPLIDYAITGLAKTELIALVDIRNIASVKILDASKMEFVEQIRSGRITDRKYVYRAN